MKYKAKWKDHAPPMEMEIDANSPYEAKKKFLTTKLKGTSFEDTFIVDQWVKMVSIKCSKDDRCRTSIPEDFSLTDFLDKEGVK